MPKYIIEREISKLEQELAIMTAMCQVIELTGQKVAIGSGHAREDESTATDLQPKTAPKLALKDQIQGGPNEPIPSLYVTYRGPTPGTGKKLHLSWAMVSSIKAR